MAAVKEGVTVTTLPHHLSIALCQALFTCFTFTISSRLPLQRGPTLSHETMVACIRPVT